MDFSCYDGYMFEELILKLLKNMGYDVEQTPLSGDGGIDLIAYNKEPITKGKYLIQCKNWKNTVGQPEVRDLYGVIMSEKANKGILITTSYYTEQAIKFAENKNIELIGYDTLNMLLKKYNLSEDTNDNHNTYHIENDGFDRAKYEYLKTRIDNNRTEKRYYDDLVTFYHEYLISNFHKVINVGIINDYIDLNNEIIKRFCKKSKANLAEGNAYKYRNGYLYLLKGELLKSIEIFYDLGLFKVKQETRFTSSTYELRINAFTSPSQETIPEENIVWKDDYDIIYKSNNIYSPSSVIQNLYLVFYYLNYHLGTQFLNSLVTDSYTYTIKLNDDIRSSWYISHNTLFSLRMKKWKDTIDEIEKNEYIKFFLPVNVYLKHNSILYVTTDSDIYIPVNMIIDNIYKNTNINIKDDLVKLNYIFNIK